MANDIIEIQNVSKLYGAVLALDKVSFSVKEGEVHTFLGENGAGKSTLVKIISGEEAPTEGQIVVDGTPVTHYTPQRAMSLGIGMVHQELAVFENLTVAENIFPNMPYRKGGFLDRKNLFDMTEEKINMFGMNIDPAQKLDELTMAQQQMVEILRSLGVGRKVILLDEPTSGLNLEETEKLMGIIRSLKQSGVTVIYISHKISEILEISDRVTVLRNGKYINTYVNDASLTERELISSMVGKEMRDELYLIRESESVGSSDIVFETRGLSKPKSVQDISFTLRKGEILGFFGLEGSGTGALSRILFGLEAISEGDIIVKGERISKPTSSVMVKHGVTYLNNNRKNAGLLLKSPSVDNMSILALDRMKKGYFIDVAKMVSLALDYIKEFGIAIKSVWHLPQNLSGGNQQKLMFSMCFANNPDILILNEPTRGVDVGAKFEIHKFMTEAAERGVSIIVFSSETPELMNLCDRVLVMHANRIAMELTPDGYSEDNIIAAASGVARAG